MFNVGGGELLVILLVALIVLGPAKLPVAARQVGGFLSSVRRMSAQFRQELTDAMPEEVNELTREIDATRKSLRSSVTDREIERKARERGRELARPAAQSNDSGDSQVSTAAAAGMFPDGDPDAAPTDDIPDADAPHTAGSAGTEPTSTDDPGTNGRSQ